MIDQSRVVAVVLFDNLLDLESAMVGDIIGRDRDPKTVITPKMLAKLPHPQST